MTARVGRNDPCPCGSGKKFKKCHEGSTIIPKEGSPAARTEAFHTLDEKLEGRIFRFAQTCEDWKPQDSSPLDLTQETSAMLYPPWALYSYVPSSGRIVDRFLAAHRAELREEELAWIEAQAKARVTAWEVTAVDAKQSFRVKDMLGKDGEHDLAEPEGAKFLQPGNVLLARVVRIGDLSVMGGMYPAPLTEEWAEEFLIQAEKAMGAELETSGPGWSAGFDEKIIRVWKRVADSVGHIGEPGFEDFSSAVPSGEALVLVDDIYEVAEGQEVAARDALLAVEGAEVDPEDDAIDFTYGPKFKTGGGKSLGRAMFDGRLLRAGTNSRARADRLRALVEGACKDFVKWQRRNEKELRPLGGRPPSGGAAKKKKTMH